MKSTARHALLVSIKLVVAAALLALVISQVHWNDYTAPDPQGGPDLAHPGVKTSLTHIRPLPLAGAFAACLMTLVIAAMRWRLLVNVQGVGLSVRESLRLTFLGSFFNAVVPGTVGGDLVKVYYAAKHTPRKAAVLMSALLDRVIGLAELALLAALMLLLTLAARLAPAQQLRTTAVVVVVVLIAMAAALAFLLSRRFRRALRLEKLYGRLPIAHHIAAAGDAARVYRHHLGHLAMAWLLSFVAHIFFVGGIGLIGVSISLPFPWYAYFLYIPLIYIIGAVPITPGGVGLIEKLYLIFFAVNPSSVLVLALLARLIPIIWSLPGLWVFLTGPRPPKVRAIEAELGLKSD